MNWISVKEGLPEIDVIVMVCVEGQRLHFGARIDDGDGWVWGTKENAFGLDLTHDVYWNDIETGDEYPVTHWHPLALPATPT